MKPSSVITPLATLGLGIAIGWFAKPDSNSAAPAPPVATRSADRSAEKPASPGDSVEEPARSRPAKSGRSASDNKAQLEKNEAEAEARATEMGDKMTEMFTGNYRKKLDSYVATLDENLKLTPQQKEALKAAIEAQLEEVKKLMARDNSDADANPAEFLKNLPALGPDALDGNLAGILSPEQKADFDAYKTREKARQVDAKALKRLANLQGIVEFKEGQRDEVYRILSESAEKSLAKPDPMAAITEIYGGAAGGMSFDMDPYDLGIQHLFMDSALESLAADQKNMGEVIREKIDGLIENKVNELKPVLDEAQLEKYRQELKTKGLGPYGQMLEHMGEEH